MMIKETFMCNYDEDELIKIQTIEYLEEVVRVLKEDAEGCYINIVDKNGQCRAPTIISCNLKGNIIKFEAAIKFDINFHINSFRVYSKRGYQLINTTSIPTSKNFDKGDEFNINYNLELYSNIPTREKYVKKTFS